VFQHIIINTYSHSQKGGKLKNCLQNEVFLTCFQNNPRIKYCARVCISYEYQRILAPLRISKNLLPIWHQTVKSSPYFCYSV